MSWQPRCEPWMLNCLNCECWILLRMSIVTSTAGTYSLALNSYLTFCKLKTTCGAHSPTTELLCHLSEFFINPRSVDSYLSHIANQLKLFFPDVWSSELVACTLAGAKWCCGTPTVCKSPLTVVNLLHVSNDLASSAHHDNILFNAQLNSGFNGLLHLGGLTWPDKLVLHDFKKVTICSSSNQSLQDYTFWLPTHKADTAFEGNKIVVHKISGTPDPHPIMMHYIKSQDSLFPFHLQIWLKADGTIALLVHWTFMALFWVGYCWSIHACWRCNCHGGGQCCPGIY